MTAREPWKERASDETAVAAYRETGAIWKAAKRLGITGQTLNERLHRLGYPIAEEGWSEEELAEARALAEQAEPLGRIAERLGRTYWAVAMKLSRLPIFSIHADRGTKPKRGSGLTKQRVAAFAKTLESGKTTVRRLALMEGVAVSPFVAALEYYEPEWWDRYVRTHPELGMRPCPGCRRDFVPRTVKQQFCTIRCGERHRRNVSYFGGRRMDAIGLREGVCQLCRKRAEKFLSAHHVLGKENDPNNEVLIALCRGCHEIVTRLATRPWVEDREIVADLVALALARRGKVNASVAVDIEGWSPEEVQEQLEAVVQSVNQGYNVAGDGEPPTSS